MRSPQRIIDANGNRAREALRVLEEAARFVVDHAELAGELKQLRHDLGQAIANMPGLIHHRDTPGDVGTELSTPSEQARAGVVGVAQAAGARLSEALRAIEEYAKVLPADAHAAALARSAERARYRGYDLAQRLLRLLGSGGRGQWRLCLLLTRSLCTHHHWQAVLEQALDAGVDAVQVREKRMDGGPLLAHVRHVIAITAQRAAVTVNDRPDIALLAGADGVHLGQSDLDPRAVRQLAGDRLIVGVSTATLDQARRAREDGADYCGVGPMFATTTKHKPELAGPAYLRDYLAWDALPHLAIGGVTPDNVAGLAALGCKGVAVSAAVCSAHDPRAAAASLIEAMPVAAPGP
ncbi:MAG: thiamine phosphate synthase [Phycisphaeraceae bacterium]